MDRLRTAKELVGMARVVLGAAMSFEDWTNLVGLQLRRSQDIADAIKVFGVDWVSGDDDAKQVDLKSVAAMIDNKVWPLIEYEASEMLLKKLKPMIKGVRVSTFRQASKRQLASKLLAIARTVLSQHFFVVTLSWRSSDDDGIDDVENKLDNLAKKAGGKKQGGMRMQFSPDYHEFSYSFEDKNAAKKFGDAAVRMLSKDFGNVKMTIS